MSALGRVGEKLYERRISEVSALGEQIEDIAPKWGRGVRNIQDAMTTYQVLKFANCGILWYRFNGSFLNVVFWGSY